MTVGCFVRVLRLPDGLRADLPPDEWADIATMLGQVFEVDELDEYGQAWVTKWWVRGDGVSQSHSLGLDPDQMERVEAEEPPPS